jgi:5-methylcytosine-specific restriction protein A
MEIKQIRFEDVYAEFVKTFGRYRGFQTTIADFKEGAMYSPFMLSIYTRTYNNRGGGIRSVGKVGVHEAVVVNITLSGGKYANEWLDPGKRLKCYLKAPPKRSESQFEEEHEANRSIMKYPHIPILVFTRRSGEPDFLYHGVFRYTQIATDDDGSKWFELLKTSRIRSQYRHTQQLNCCAESCCARHDCAII